MSEQVRNSIQELLNESSQFNANDVLVNVSEEDPKLIFRPLSLTFNLSDFPKRILREAQKTQKESGVNSLCIADGTVQLKIGEKDVVTPITLTPVQYTINKLKQTITLDRLDENSFLNPFLKRHLDVLGVETKSKVLNFDGEGVVALDPPLNTGVESIIDQLEHLDLETEDISIVGNFHHHRYEIVKELEELLELDSISGTICELFGEPTNAVAETINFSNDLIFPADVDHESVFDIAQENNTVIQGPPGTGKSQVLSNLLGKILAAEKTTVVVSEKRVALEVLQKKLSSFELDKLCFIASSDRLSHSFLQELKSTWDFFESYAIEPVNNLRLSEQYEANLQMTLDLLSQKELIGGVSFHEFQEYASGKDLGKYEYSSEVLSLLNFEVLKAIVSNIYFSKLNASISALKKQTIEADNFVGLDVKIEAWISLLNELKSDFDFASWNDFSNLMLEAAKCQIYENDLYKKYADIFRHNSKAQQRFLSLRKKYLKATSALENIASNHSEWKILPSETEVLALQKSLAYGGFFEKRKAKKRWAEISNIPFQSAQDSLKMRLDEIAKSKEISQIKVNFCEIGIDSPETEVSLIHQTLSSYSADEWKNLQELSSEKRLKLTSKHRLLSNLFVDLKSHFNFENDLVLTSYMYNLKHSFSEILSLKNELQKLDEVTLKLIGKNSTFDSFEGMVLNSHRTKFKDRFPAFSDFEMSQIEAKVNDVLNAQNTESKLFAQEIQNKVAKQFKSYHELLTIPARKLSEEQKQLKARLRKGKSILVKEFSKTRSHPSLRELFNSEAREWIQLLKPIWLSNPAQISKCFPLEQQLFDIAIFDEASQIPLQNALGTIERSGRIIVAGDEHQMGPTSYFKSGNNEVMDLLHQANYYWSRAELKHHYRSEHPQLIAFSNKHFYEGELKAFPSVSSNSVLRHHFVDGQFIDRKNETEALALAKQLEGVLDENETVGVVAFSEEQLNCIWKSLSESAQQKLSDKLEKNEGFFKSLENVQGDECDHLLISFGYGKNEEGEFHMRFGPMNTLNGRKRLNVLLTRAIKSIDFFCSVRSSDFKLSDNESINLLRQWIAFSESASDENLVELPFGLNGTIDGNTITLSRIQDQLSVAREVATLQNVLVNRGWKVVYS